MSGPTRPAGHFEALYARDPDPWRFRTSAYEQAKYADTVAALDGRRFGRAVEIGCSIGELTGRLAPFCDALLGVDLAEAALEAARARCLAHPHVAFARMTLPDEAPPGPFDLIVLSEVLYFFAADDLARMAAWARRACAEGGVVLLVNWMGEADDPMTGEAAAGRFIQATCPPMKVDRRRRGEGYRLDRLIAS